ncbi:hypothetical protein BDY21DRAFT_136037 [Lineolata rhizophorae]|uniref:Uncharacterized protein n=1 Tax=Lineolata rhizophorae TaxID=578093 RepID=A0A6A6PC08_9PEZI|nr:hypothetical protein BDY21DRAFT_136037 [Lineolata rhizophorae]
MAGASQPRLVIDLTNEDSDNSPAADPEFNAHLEEFMDAAFNNGADPAVLDFPQLENGAGSGVSHASPANPMLLTEEDFLQKVLEVFPDIARDHVLEAYRERAAMGRVDQEWCGEFIVQVLDANSYPKERDRKDLKRKRGDVADAGGSEDWENAAIGRLSFGSYLHNA